MDVPFEVGAIVEVYFELPIGYAVEARAEVVRQANGPTAPRHPACGPTSKQAWDSRMAWRKCRRPSATWTTPAWAGMCPWARASAAP
ncbi:MAG: hypothetical protein KF718_32880 [Polyangiaceae bacterium]|nr:hypothetical protein [Polyangiaceae bacterium]